jgi:sulfotransferase
MKEIFFLAGLQRSGATIISQILNQNPNVWVTPASPLFTMMKGVFESHTSPEYIDYQRPDAMAEVLHEMSQAFYKDKSAQYIIDKNLNWPTPIGVEMIARYISANIKIICPVRNILDILVSFDSIINAHPDSANNQIDKAVLTNTPANKPLADRRADLLMQEDKDIFACLHNMKYALVPEYRHLFHFVDYDDFITDPEKEINKIYDFLEIPKYNHEFENIVDSSGISRESLTGIKDLHTIRPKVQKVSKRPQDVFLPETIKRYSGLEFWRELR